MVGPNNKYISTTYTYTKRNPAYGRHRISRPMQIEALIPKKNFFFLENNRRTLFKIVWSQPIITNIFFDERSTSRSWCFKLTRIGRKGGVNPVYFWKLYHHSPVLEINTLTDMATQWLNQPSGPMQWKYPFKINYYVSCHS